MHAAQRDIMARFPSPVALGISGEIALPQACGLGVIAALPAEMREVIGITTREIATFFFCRIASWMTWNASSATVPSEVM
jgi:hypothetical protein